MPEAGRPTLTVSYSTRGLERKAHCITAFVSVQLLTAIPPQRTGATLRMSPSWLQPPLSGNVTTIRKVEETDTAQWSRAFAALAKDRVCFPGLVLGGSRLS